MHDWPAAPHVPRPAFVPRRTARRHDLSLGRSTSGPKTATGSLRKSVQVSTRERCPVFNRGRQPIQAEARSRRAGPGFDALLFGSLTEDRCARTPPCG
jgi:hypothetical protein